ncbi:MAG: hypothetical protein WAU49_09620 [Steroidobacteraceae bacterium]
MDEPQNQGTGDRRIRLTQTNSSWGPRPMNIHKIVGIVGLLIAILAAFMKIPYAMELMAIAGIIVAFNIAAEDSVRVIVSAIAMPIVAGLFNGLPSFGMYLTSILTNVGYLIGGAALLIILRNVFNRLLKT